MTHLSVKSKRIPLVLALALGGLLPWSQPFAGVSRRRRLALIGSGVLASLVAAPTLAQTACPAGVVNGPLTCTNSLTLSSSTPAQATMGASGNADITNTVTGQISAGSNASAVYAGGGLTLNNSGQILTLLGGSNVTVMSSGSKAGTSTITNSGYMGDQAANGGGAQNVIRSQGAGSTFTLNNTATGTIKSTTLGNNAVTVQLQSGVNAVTNAGAILATTGQSALTVLNSATSTLNNSGSLNAAGTATFYGVVADTSGTLNVTNSGGIWGARSGVWLAGGVSATINNTGTGTITATGALSARGVDYKPAIQLDSGSSLDLTNSGVITAGGAGIKVASGARSATIINSGTISSTASSAPAQFKVSGLHLDSTTGATSVTNSGTISGTSYGVYLNSGTMTLNNTGTLSGATGFAAGTGAVVKLFNGGTITGSGGTAVDLTAGGAGSVFTLGSGYSVTGVVKGKSTDTFQLGGTGAASFDFSSFGAGRQYQGFTTLNVVGGTWTGTGATTSNMVINGGNLTVNGALTAASINASASAMGVSSTLAMNGGELTTVDGTILGNGAVLTGSGHIKGTVQAQAGSLVQATLGGTTAGVSHDKLVFDQAVTLGGDLNVLWKAGFSGSAGQVFDLFDWNGGVSGSFASVVLPTLTSGLQWDTSDLYIGGSVKVNALVAAVPEPQTYVMMLACLLVTFSFTRRRGN